MVSEPTKHPAKWPWLSRPHWLAAMATVLLATPLVLFVPAGTQLSLAKPPSAAAASTGCAVSTNGTTTAPTMPGAGLPSWTSFEGNAAHDLIVPASTPAGPMSTSWSFQPNGEIGTAPSVVGGVAYLTSLDQCIYALDVATGKEIWSFHANQMSMSEPLVTNGRVFFGTGNKVIVRTASGGILRGTGANAIYALNAATGKELWSFNTYGENMPTLLYSNGTVYAATGGSMMYALNAASGKLQWSLPVHSVVSMSSPEASGHIAVFGGADPYAFYGVNLSTGKIAWTLPVQAEGGIDDNTPTIANGIAYVQVPEGIFPRATVVEFAINVATGQNLWQTVLGQGSLPTNDKEETGVATAYGGVLYVGSPALHSLYALNIQPGAPLWAAPPSLPAGVRPSPMVMGNHIVVADNAGGLDVIDRSSGQWLRTIQIGVRVPGTGECTTPAPELVGQTLLFATGKDAVLTAEPFTQVLAGDRPATAARLVTPAASTAARTLTPAPTAASGHT